MITTTWKLEQAILYGVFALWFFLAFNPREMLQCGLTCAFMMIIDAIISHHEVEAA